MNAKEFAALKVGDLITNPMNNDAQGVISKTTPSGVHVAWGGNAMEFFYSLQSSAWMHWGKGE